MAHCAASGTSVGRALAVVIVVAMAPACHVTDSLEDCSTDADCAPSDRCNPEGSFCERDTRPIVIGTLLREPGMSLQQDDWRAAIDLAIAEIDAAGGILGRDVVLATRSTFPPDAARASVSALLAEGMVGFVGSVNSSQTLTAAEVLHPERVLVISPTATSPAITTAQPEMDRYLFRTEPPIHLGEAAAMVQHAGDACGTLGVVVQREDAYFDGYASAVRDLFPKTGACLAWIGTTPPDPQPSYPEVIDAIRTTVPECVLLLSEHVVTTTVMSELAAATAGEDWSQLDWLVPSNHLDDRFLAMLTPGVAPAGPVFASSSLADPSRLAYMELQRAYNASLGRPADQELSPNTAGYYDAVVLLAYAIVRAGGTGDRVAIRDSLWEVARRAPDHRAVRPRAFAEGVALLAAGSAIKYVGASGELDFDSFGDVAGLGRVWRLEGTTFLPHSDYSPEQARVLNDGPGTPSASCPPPQMLMLDGA